MHYHVYFIIQIHFQGKKIQDGNQSGQDDRNNCRMLRALLATIFQHLHHKVASYNIQNSARDKLQQVQ